MTKSVEPKVGTCPHYNLRILTILLAKQKLWLACWNLLAMCRWSVFMFSWISSIRQLKYITRASGPLITLSTHCYVHSALIFFLRSAKEYWPYICLGWWKRYLIKWQITYVKWCQIRLIGIREHSKGTNLQQYLLYTETEVVILEYKWKKLWYNSGSLIVCVNADIGSVLLNSIRHALVHFNVHFNPLCHQSYQPWSMPSPQGSSHQNHQRHAHGSALHGNDLLMEDKWLIESGKWINDQIICAWQFLLQQKYPSVGSLHSTVLVSKRNSREIRGSMKLCKFSTVETTTGLQYQHLGVMLVLCTGWTACTVDHHLS